MKKIKYLKRMLIITLVIGVFFSLNQVVWVSAAEKTDTNSALQTFSDFCDSYYIADEEYTVWNKEEEDISSAFYSSTIALYNEGKIKEIYEYAKENVSMFQKTVMIEEDSLRSSFQTVTVSDWFYKFVNTGKYCPEYEIKYTLSGRFTYNYNTGEISSYTNPTIALDYCSLISTWSGNMVSATTKGTVSADKYSITFYGSFKMQTTCSVPIGSITVPGFQETHGPFNAELRASGA